MYFVYILQSFDSVEHYYVGFTENIDGRLADHNSGKVTNTAKHGLWKIKIYVAFSDRQQAPAFEKYLKSGSVRAFAKKRL